MRKMLVVVVIAGVACLEPAPQPPVNNRIVEHKRPPPRLIAGVACGEAAPQAPVSTAAVAHSRAPTGRIKIMAPQKLQLPDLERTYGPVIASGTVAGHPWFLRGRIDTLGAATWLQTGNGGGGGGRGRALPFQDLGWTKMRHFGSVSSGEHWGIGSPRTLSLDGVVSKQTAAIDVQLADGTSFAAQIIDTGDARANFFVAVWSVPSRWESLIARDAAGAELETCRPH